MLSDLFSNLANGFRLAAFLPARRAPFRATPGQLVLLLLLLWGLVAIADWMDVGAAVKISRWGLAAEAAHDYFWLAAILLVLLVDRRPAAFTGVATAVAAAEFTVWIVWIAVSRLGPHYFPAIFDGYEDMIWTGAFVWQGLIFLRVMLGPHRKRLLPAALLTGIYVGAMYLLVDLVPERSLFVAAHQTNRVTVDVEDTYYRQSGLVDDALAALAPERPGTTDLYFVGFAGDANQDVFLHEVDQVSDLMAERFDTDSRSIELVNSEQTLTELPLANRRNLERVLAGIGRQMNTEEDVLFLFMTSHGTDKAALTVQFPPLGLHDLAAAELRKALDASGIKWRVLVISACYSGSFVKTLESPTTLVITAAAEDRASFGCGHERDWTYFGEAYFDKALRQTRSFVAAFDAAKESIARRESDEHKDHSRPQLSLGGEMRRKLGEWERTRAAP
ncbi:MAG: hypothetical protein HY749_20130 [Gammaproteobacteria bacterium]|nr:hypothetical protein [Gammaproteobacteria bacterium]